LQNLFELLSFLATVIFPRPEQFRYPALMSAVAVLVAGILYAEFVRRRRGHLLHVSGACGACCAEDREGKASGRGRWKWRRIGVRSSVAENVDTDVDVDMDIDMDVDVGGGRQPRDRLLG
jgi:hypothetical protein